MLDQVQPLIGEDKRRDIYQRLVRAGLTDYMSVDEYFLYKYSMAFFLSIMVSLCMPLFGRIKIARPATTSAPAAKCAPATTCAPKTTCAPRTTCAPKMTCAPRRCGLFRRRAATCCGPAKSAVSYTTGPVQKGAMQKGAVQKSAMQKSGAPMDGPLLPEPEPAVEDSGMEEGEL